MNDPQTMWVMYYAQSDAGPQHFRIKPETIRVLEISASEVSGEHLDEVRQQTGLGYDLTVLPIELPAGVSEAELTARATQYIAELPEFNFWEDVIGDDVVVDGVVYNGDLYEADGQGGIRERSDDQYEFVGSGEGDDDWAPVQNPTVGEASSASTWSDTNTRPITAGQPVPSRLQPPGTAGARHAGIMPPRHSGRSR